MAVAYFFIAHEEGAGTALLGIMTAALSFAALYAVVAERDADLEGDYPNKRNEEVAGENLGIFTTETPYPILIAVSALAMMTGMLWSPLLGDRRTHRTTALLLAIRGRERANVAVSSLRLC